MPIFNRLASLLLFLVVTPLLAAPAPVTELQVTELQDHLNHPWSLAFLPDNNGILITERSGQLRRWLPDKGLSAPIKGVPEVYVRTQSGLFDVLLAPDFATSRRVYLSYGLEKGGKMGIALGYGRLSDDYLQLLDFKQIFEQQPKLSPGYNLGGRIAFDRQGQLFLSIGDNNQRRNAQALDQWQGKLLRLTPEGQPAAHNPFADRATAHAEIWSYGHRNPQGLALNPWSGVMWESEHGPRGGDEVNIPLVGKNYGWPLATYGIDYSGLPIPEAKGTSAPGTEPPLYYWKKSPALSGMAFYAAQRFPTWQHSLFIGALAERELIQLTLRGDQVVAEQRLLSERKERIRDVRVGPDGYLYLLTDEDNGKLLRLGAKNEPEQAITR